MSDERNELEEAFEKAHSYESRAAWGAEGLETFPVGTLEKRGRLYDLCVDSGGNYWYTVRIRTDRGPVPEREAIFGKKRIWRFSRR